MSAPKTQLSLISNLWIKLMTFDQAGDVNEGHKQVYSGNARQVCWPYHNERRVFGYRH
jgi:hypothetical protein